MADIPFSEACDRAEVLIKSGVVVYQKWTCSHCGSRQTMERANSFFKQGECEECGQVTLITECGYMVVAGLTL